MAFGENLLNLTEAARFLGIKRRTIERLVATGQLGVVRIGARCVRVRPSEIERFIDARDSRAPQFTRESKLATERRRRRRILSAG